jgi:hypothetical protein
VKGAPPAPASTPAASGSPQSAASNAARSGTPNVRTSQFALRTATPDTTVYGASDLQDKPALVSIPEPSDDVKKTYPGMLLPVWVVVEKDGTVSAAEVRINRDLHGLDTIVSKLARSARFTPGRVNGKAVRSATTFTFRISKSVNQ